MPLIIIAISVVIAIPLYMILAPWLTEKYCLRRINEASPDSPTLIPSILKAFLPRKHIFTDISLPIPGRDGEEISYGTVAVCRAGIFIVSRICGDGLIENPPGASKWRLISRGSVTEFPNPFKDQEAPRKLLTLYADAAGAKNTRIHTMIVYTNSELRFSCPPPKGVVHVSRLYGKMRRLSSRGTLSSKDARAIAKLISDVNSGIRDIQE